MGACVSISLGFSHWRIEPQAVVNSLKIGKNSLSSEKQLSFLKYFGITNDSGVNS
jgi:hypothetical protein